MRQIIAIAVLTAFSFNASAVVINNLGGVDYQWLELTETQGMSRDDVELQLADVNSDLYGYEYASRALVESLLWSYASWDGLNGYHGDPGVVAGMTSYLNDFGVLDTYPGEGEELTWITVDGFTVQYDTYIRADAIFGLDDECGGLLTSCGNWIEIYLDEAGNPTMVRQYYGDGWDASGQMGAAHADSWWSPARGAYLVQSVPVPASVWLFGSALAGLGWMRRRKAV